MKKIVFSVLSDFSNLLALKWTRFHCTPSLKHRQHTTYFYRILTTSFVVSQNKASKWSVAGNKNGYQMVCISYHAWFPCLKQKYTFMVPHNVNKQLQATHTLAKVWVIMNHPNSGLSEWSQKLLWRSVMASHWIIQCNQNIYP